MTWIPVKERLPKNGEQVVLAYDEGRPHGASARSYWFELDVWSPGQWPENLSYWMPFPEPPKESE
jgi:hypothetical protein